MENYPGNSAAEMRIKLRRFLSQETEEGECQKLPTWFSDSLGLWLIRGACWVWGLGYSSMSGKECRKEWYLGFIEYLALKSKCCTRCLVGVVGVRLEIGSAGTKNERGCLWAAYQVLLRYDIHSK